MLSLGRRAVVPLIAALSIAFGGCAGPAGRQTSGEQIPDSEITARVAAALAADPRVRAASLIQVETLGGVVRLTGFADSRLEADDALAIARSVRGVRSVRDGIVVRVRPDRRP